MGRYICSGILLGTGIGIILYFIFPQLLQVDILLNSTFKQQVGLPIYSSKGVDLGGCAFLIGLMGGVLGFVIYKIKKYKQKRK